MKRKLWRIIPRIEYCNYRKAFPNMGDCFTDWFYVRRYWSGRLVNIGIKHHCIVLDFRNNWMADLLQ